MDDADVNGCSSAGCVWLLKVETGFMDGELDGVGELDFELEAAGVLFDSFLKRGMVFFLLVLI